jgi:putative ABC transport system permease protein
MSARRGGSFLSRMAEGVAIALDSIKSNRVRAALTILGVAIGVTVVIAMASAITGINRSVTAILESAGPKTFFVVRYFSGGLDVSDGSDELSPWRRMPWLTVEEAELIRRLPLVRDVNIGEYAQGPVGFEGVELKSVSIAGFSPTWNLVNGGDLLAGRNFTNMEYAASSRVVIINDKLAESLFPRRDAVGKTIKIFGEPFEVIGLHVEAASLFSNADEPRLAMPHTTFTKVADYWKGWMEVAVLPAETATVQETQDQVLAALRAKRGLRPGQPDNFAIVTQDRVLDTFNNITAAFFIAMIALSSVGLMVGGVGVVAIMMISVTERDRRPEGPRCDPAGDHVPVPSRGRDAHAGRVCRRHGAWRLDRLGDPLVHTDPGHRATVIGRCRGRRVDPDGRAVWPVPREQGVPDGSGGGVEV